MATVNTFSLLEVKSRGKSPQVNVFELDYGKIINMNWCKKNPYVITPVTYSTTLLKYSVGIPKVFLLNPPFAVTEVCDAVDPVFSYSLTYQIRNSASHSLTYLYKYSISSSSGSITTLTTSPAGTYEVRIVGTLQNRQFYSQLFTLEGSVPSIKYFESSFKDFIIRHDQNFSPDNPYIHPIVFDSDLNVQDTSFTFSVV
jgi:hypothetical protein